MLLVFIASALIVSIYRYRLESKMKKLVNELEKERFSHQKNIEFMQDRHKKRIEALDEVTSSINEFRHDVGHLERGDSVYSERLQENYLASRSLSRKYESLLGEQFNQAIHHITDLGKEILTANLILTDEAFQKIEGLLPENVRKAVNQIVGKNFPVTKTEEIAHSLGEDVDWQYVRMLISRSTLSGDYFDRDGYEEASHRVRELSEEIRKTLPIISTKG